MIHRYWSILTHFCTFKLIPFAIVPWWLLCLRYSFRPAEALYLLLMVLVTALIWLYAPFDLGLGHLADFGEVLIWCIFVFLGHSLFAQATEARLVALAGIIALVTLIDFYMLDLTISRWLAGSPTAQDIIRIDRGAYTLAPEPSYWGLTLVGFYTYTLTRRWWLAAWCFGLLMWWNQGIYQFAILLLCSVFLLPLRVLVKFALVFIVGIPVLYGLDLPPQRLATMYLSYSEGLFDGPGSWIDRVYQIEEMHGSVRVRYILDTFLNAGLLGPAEISGRAHSVLSQLVLLQGWIIAPIFWALVLGLIWNRYRLQLRHAILLVVLGVATGPVSIPFVYSFLFALPQRQRGHPAASQSSPETLRPAEPS